MPDTIDYSQAGTAESTPHTKRSAWALRLITLLAAVAAALWTLGDLEYQIERVASVETAARQSLDRQRQRATRLAVEVAAAQYARIQDGYRFLRVIAGLSSLPTLNAESCTDLLRKHLINEPLYTNVGVANKSGTPLCSAFPMPMALTFASLPREAALLAADWSAGTGAERAALLLVVPIMDQQAYLGAAFTALDPQQLLNVMNTRETKRVALITAAGVVAASDTSARPRLSLTPKGQPVEAVGNAAPQSVYGFAKLLDTSPALYTAVGLSAPPAPDVPRDEIYLRAAVLVLLVGLASYLAGFGRDAFLYRCASRFSLATRGYARRALDSARAAARKRLVKAQSFLSLRDTGRRSQTKIELRQANEALKRALEQFERRDREMAALNELSRHLQTCSSAEEIQAMVEQFSQQLFPDMAGELFLLNGTSGGIESQHSWGAPSRQKRQLETDDCWALRLLKAHRVEGAGAALCCAHVVDAPSGGYVCTPLLAHGELLGMLHLQGRPPFEADFVSADEIAPRTELTQEFAERVASALANVSLRENLRVQSIRDVLTGLYNRRFLEEAMAIEEQRALREGSAVGLAMLDIDYFKRFNDTFGHDAGDALLREIGSFLRAQVREGDTACRYGGEEFTLILPGADLASTCQRAETLRRNAALLEVVYHNRPLGPITLSIGVASYPQHGNSMPDVLKAADRALYRAKHAGRNRVLPA